MGMMIISFIKIYGGFVVRATSFHIVLELLLSSGFQKLRQAAGINYWAMHGHRNILMTFIKQMIAGQASLDSHVVVERRVRLGKKFVKKNYIP